MRNFSMHWLTLRKAAYCALRPSLWRQLFYGVAPTIEHADALSRYRFKTVIDVGGNRGQFATFARRLFPGAVIHSFEPLRTPAHIFRNVLFNDANVHLHAKAIGETSRNAEIYVTTRDDSSSLFAPASAQADIFGQRIKRKEQVQVLPLADCLEVSQVIRPTLLKIDVQGGELDVLRGSSDVLSLIDVIYVECSYIAMYENQPLYRDVAAWLTAHGFDLAGVFNQYSDAQAGPVQADFLFVRHRANETAEVAA